jgi:ubiquitin-conjugating enzyme (huntingtin interacting protein 2)
MFPYSLKPGNAAPLTLIFVRYRGYNSDLIQRFVDAGYDIEAVVKAFEYVGVDRNNGQDYELEEAYQGDILARLSDD